MELGGICSWDTWWEAAGPQVWLRTMSQQGLWQELMDTTPLLPQEWDFTDCLQAEGCHDCITPGCLL